MGARKFQSCLNCGMSAARSIVARPLFHQYVKVCGSRPTGEWFDVHYVHDKNHVVDASGGNAFS
ncbi:hypothetical protein FF011L_23480 [Roseimaritima multifibrata]|uniref:Uncharacterized protein n=1 Tax=Roseimaritima multifibrata TaxID=1930274 RepID=A0A517MFB1_9BACT|nr:hypothetical protein FF011L_23480 [Roseimaritima multifibrata]